MTLEEFILRFNRGQPHQEVSTPEITLIAAILQRAVRDLSPDADDDSRRDAVAWFRGRESRVNFKDCADFLGLGYKLIKLIQTKVDEAEALYGNKSVLEGKESRERNSPMVEGEWIPLRKKVSAI